MGHAMTVPMSFLIVDSGERQPELIARFEVEGEPRSKARARTVRAGNKLRTYSPESNVRAEAVIRQAYLEQTNQVEDSTEKTFAVRATFYHATRQRRDVDNMLKLILDGLNGAAWADDMQVIEVVGRKVLTEKAEARTVVEVYRVGDVPRLTTLCQNCCEPMITYPSWQNVERRKKFCSAECRRAKSAKDRERKCQQCGKKFAAKGKAEDRTFCSAKCKTSAGSVQIECVICGKQFTQHRSWVESRPCCSSECSEVRAKGKREERASKYFPGTCLICGAGTTRKEYKRCNPCKLAGKTV